jgi:hypothetical protein
MNPKKTRHEKWTSKVRKQQARINRLCHKYGLPPGNVSNLERAVVQSVATYGIELNNLDKTVKSPKMDYEIYKRLSTRRGEQ